MSPQSGLLKNVSQLTLATIAGQLLLALNLLLLAWLLSQEDVGVYSVFMSYAAMLATVSLLSYEVTLPNVDDDNLPAYLQALLGLVIATACIVGIGFALSGYRYAELLAGQTFALGLIRLSEFVNVREGCFGLISFGRIAPHAGFLLLLGGYAGLPDSPQLGPVILGYVLVFVAVAVVYSFTSLRNKLHTMISWKACAQLLYARRRNPAFITPSELFNSMAYNLPVILIDRFFGAEIAAQYNIMLRFGFGPVSILGNTVGSVFHSRLAGAVRAGEGALGLYGRARNYLLPAALAVGLGVFFLYPPAIRFLLGQEWLMSAQFCQLMAPLFAAMVLVAPLSVTFYVLERQAYLFANQLAYLLIALLAFAFGIALDSIWLAVALFSILSIVRYVFIFAKINQLLHARLEG